MIKLRVHLQPHVQTNVWKHILRSQSNRPMKVISEIMARKRLITVEKFKSNGRAGWSEGIKSTKDRCFLELIPPFKDDAALFEENPDGLYIEDDGEARDKGEVKGKEEEIRKEHFASPPAFEHFRCSACGHAVSACRATFDRSGLDAMPWCRKCKRTRIAKSWLCRCGTPWFQCPVHKGSPDDMRKYQEALLVRRSSSSSQKDPKKGLRGKVRFGETKFPEESSLIKSSQIEVAETKFGKETLQCSESEPEKEDEEDAFLKKQSLKKRKFEAVSFSACEVEHTRQCKASFLSPRLLSKFSHLV